MVANDEKSKSWSQFTHAILEDSGWYVANYSTID
jgi:hypothetical protein